jgi:hypothetical protein
MKREKPMYELAIFKTRNGESRNREYQGTKESGNRGIKERGNIGEWGNQGTDIGDIVINKNFHFTVVILF